MFWFWFYSFSFNFSSVVVCIFYFYCCVFLVFVLPLGVIKNDHSRPCRAGKSIIHIHLRRHQMTAGGLYSCLWNALFAANVNCTSGCRLYVTIKMHTVLQDCNVSLRTDCWFCLWICIVVTAISVILEVIIYVDAGDIGLLFPIRSAAPVAHTPVFIVRQHTDARYWYSNSVRLSVRPSMETA